MFRSTLYSFLLLPAFLLQAAKVSASIRDDNISASERPDYYVVRTGYELPSDVVILGVNDDKVLVVDQNATHVAMSISSRVGDLYIGPDPDFQTLTWVPNPYYWFTFNPRFPFGLGTYKSPDEIVCWHNINADSVELKTCPFDGAPDAIEFVWQWESGTQ